MSLSGSLSQIKIEPKTQRGCWALILQKLEEHSQYFSIVKDCKTPWDIKKVVKALENLKITRLNLMDICISNSLVSRMLHHKIFQIIYETYYSYYYGDEISINDIRLMYLCDIKQYCDQTKVARAIDRMRKGGLLPGADITNHPKFKAIEYGCKKLYLELDTGRIAFDLSMQQLEYCINPGI